MKKLSVVLPAYNEELMVRKTCRVLRKILTEAEIPYELVIVNDRIEKIDMAGNSGGRKRRQKYSWCSFSRNFGKEAAFFAGLAQACGDGGCG